VSLVSFAAMVNVVIRGHGKFCHSSWPFFRARVNCLMMVSSNRQNLDPFLKENGTTNVVFAGYGIESMIRVAYDQVYAVHPSKDRITVTTLTTTRSPAASRSTRFTVQESIDCVESASNPCSVVVREPRERECH